MIGAEFTWLSTETVGGFLEYGKKPWDPMKNVDFDQLLKDCTA